MTRDRQILFYDCLNTEYKRTGREHLFKSAMALGTNGPDEMRHI